MRLFAGWLNSVVPLPVVAVHSTSGERACHRLSG